MLNKKAFAVKVKHSRSDDPAVNECILNRGRPHFTSESATVSNKREESAEVEVVKVGNL